MVKIPSPGIDLHTGEESHLPLNLLLVLFDLLELETGLFELLAKSVVQLQLLLVKKLF